MQHVVIGPTACSEYHVRDIVPRVQAKRILLFSKVFLCIQLRRCSPLTLLLSMRRWQELFLAQFHETDS